MRVPSLLLLALLIPSLLPAQQGEDIRISPPETPYYALPTQYRIQSADRIGDITLAVWGTALNLFPARPSQGRALSPKGIFIGDTLYAVWDDLRNGDVDIYGTGVALPSIPATLSVAAEEPAGTPRARVVPNPAGDAFRIEFGRPTDSDTELELIDMRGFVVGRDTAPAGASTATISTREYGSGLYRLRWRRDGGVESLPVMIVH